MKDEIQILNRTLRWTKEGTTCEADQRHAEIVIKDMNMKKANAVSTPAVPEPSEKANLRLSNPDMAKDEASRFRGLVARVNYLSLVRSRLAVRGEDSEPAHGSAQGVRLGQDQADREVLRQSLPGCPKVCVCQENPHNSQRTSSQNPTGYGAVERRGRALRHAQRTKPDLWELISMMADFGERS